MLAKPLILLAALATTLATAGCVALDGEEWGSMSMAEEPRSFGGVDFGTIEILSVTVEPIRTLPNEVAARVTAEVRVANAEAPWVEIVLDDEGCSAYGPPSAPTSRAASEWRALPADRAAATHTLTTTLRGSAMPDLEGSVFVDAKAANSVGPIFGECREFVRVP